MCFFGNKKNWQDFSKSHTRNVKKTDIRFTGKSYETFL